MNSTKSVTASIPTREMDKYDHGPRNIFLNHFLRYLDLYPPDINSIIMSEDCQVLSGV